MHWTEFDYRRKSLEFTINALEKAHKAIIKDTNKIFDFDRQFAIEASTPILGLCFIAFQNYINHTIADFFPNNKFDYYNLENNEKLNSRIDLIVALANVAKHKEEEKINVMTHKWTRERLERFGLKYDDGISDILYNGLGILSAKYSIKDVTQLCFEWREKLVYLVRNSK